MGRYANRFEAGGSVGVGSTFTAAAGGGNTKFAVAANGQVLNRTSYPGLASYYSGQSALSRVTNNSFLSATGLAGSGHGYYPITAESGYKNNNNGLVSASGSGFTIFAQPIRFAETNTAPRGTAIWRTTDGNDWSLVSIFEPPSGNVGSGQYEDIGVLSVNNTIFLCTYNGLLSSIDGINYTNVYSASQITSVASDGVNYILTNGTTSGLRTSDFVNYTGVGLSGTLTGTFATFYSGNYYVFQSGVTGVRFSADSGQTWTSPTSGLRIAAGNSAAVLNNNLIVSVSGAGTGLFQYSINPTGTTNTWAVSPITWPVGGDNRFITHYLFDGTSYVFSVAQASTGNPSSGVFGYVTTGLNVTGFRYYAQLPNSFSGLVDGAGRIPGATTFAIATGTKKAFNLGCYIQYQPTGTNWSGAVNVTATTVGVSAQPFFTTTYQRERVGATNSGNRYIHKLIGPNNNAYSSIHVEVSGVYKLLSFASGSGYSDSNVYAGDLINNTYVVESSGVYLTVATRTGGSSNSGIFHNRHSQSTFIAQRQSGFQYTGEIEKETISGVLGPVNDGVYFLSNTSTGISGAYIKANTTTVETGFSRFSSNTGLSFNVRNYQFSYVTNSVSIGGFNGDGTGLFFCEFKNNTVTNVPADRISVFNATGGSIGGTFVSGTQIFSISNGIYAVNISGVSGIYKYTNGAFRYFADYTPPTSGTFGQVYVQTSPNVILGGTHFSFDTTPLITVLATSGSAGIGGFQPAPVYINYTNQNNESVYRMSEPLSLEKTPTGSVVRFISPLGATGFVVPDITSTTTGEAKYIIAR